MNCWEEAKYLLKKIGILMIIPDKLYLKLSYRKKMGEKLDLKNPKTFNEKIQWLKIYDRNPLYTKLVDKYEVREYIKEKIGEEYLIPLEGGPWDNADEIDFDTLPERFVLKCTHDSGSVIVCRDKAKLDIAETRKRLNRCLSINFYYPTREWPYKDVKPRIIAERYMQDKTCTELRDYKFYCFNGKSEYLYVSEGLENHSTAKISFLTRDWEFAPFERGDYKPFKELPQKPSNYDRMLEIAEYLSKGVVFVRMDLYEINGRIYFSEFTFHPCSGFMPLHPQEWDRKLGELLDIGEDGK